MAMPKADRKLMREINSMQVLHQVRMHGPISRPELAEQTGLGLSTISNIVTELLESKLIREVGEGDSSGGRRPSLLDINELARYAFGVKIGPEQVWISSFDLRGHKISSREISFVQGAPPEELFEEISKVVDAMRHDDKIPKRSILGIGVSTSGLIDAKSGICLYSPILGWDNVSIRDRLSKLTRLDVIVENDVNAFAYGTSLHDANANTRNLICITTGTGVGAGIILDKKLYRGSLGGAGEFGHMTIDINGPKCACGRRGCLDVMASDKYLVARARESVAADEPSVLGTLADERKLSAMSVFLAAQLNDPLALHIYEEFGRNLGAGVANLINLFNPDKIVVGGEGAVASKFFMPTLRTTAFEQAFPHLTDHLEIVVDDGSEDVWLQGAALLVIEKFFEVPLSS